MVLPTEILYYLNVHTVALLHQYNVTISLPHLIITDTTS